MVIEYVGEIIGQHKANLREKENDRRGVDMYMFRIDDDAIVDATRTGNQARFINHSCDVGCRVAWCGRCGIQVCYMM